MGILGGAGQYSGRYSQAPFIPLDLILTRRGSSGPTLSNPVPAAQQQFPTSAYGQVVPVIWGKARVPGGYIWTPEISVDIDGDKVRVRMSARIRFAAPLVSDSTWKLRRLWENGKLVVDNSTGYKKSGLNYRFYDGRSTQGRDPHMVDIEGETNVSAHRGYLDIVIQRYNIGAEADAPPVFESELVQDDTSSVDVDVTTGFFSNSVNTFAAADWENGRWFGITTSPAYVRVFDIGANRETYAVPLNGLLGSINENSLLYIPEMDRLVAVDFLPGPLGGAFPCVIDPSTGEIVAHGEVMGPAGQNTNVVCAVPFNQNAGAMIAVSFNSGYLSTYTFGSTYVNRQFQSGSGWDGRGVIECIAVGEVRTDEADVYLVTGTKLYKGKLTSAGFLTDVMEIYSDADDLVYCLFHDNGIIVWNDNAEVMRVSTAGVAEWTKTVPYQIVASAAARNIAPPQMHNLDGILMLQEPTAYNFTNLDTGTTQEVAKSSTQPFRYVYDGFSRTILTTDTSTTIAQRSIFDPAGPGTTRDLEDFIAAVWERTGFSSTEHDELNIDDQIQGAVIDITGGGREIVRSVGEPYSFSMWERDGQILTKRALTDGSFVVDATISSTDIVDEGGQSIRARRLNPEEFIARYGVNYRDPDEIYQARPQWGEIPSLPLPVAPTDIGIKADIPIIVDGDTIKVLATKKVNRLAVEKHEFELKLRAKYADLEPEDIIRFTFANRTVTARIFETTLNPDFSITVTCTEFLSSTSVAISGGTGRPVEPDQVGSVLSKYYHLDIPLLNDTDDTSGLVQYHVLASAGQPNWDGATLYRKDGSTYLPQVSQVQNGLVGVALTALPDWDIPYVTEFTREITVAIISGDTDILTSATYQEVCEGANMFAIGQPGRWEVCHVIDITDNGDGSFTFTGLRRGRGSSEEYTGTHQVGDLVVWLSDDNVQHLEYAIDALNDSFDFKPVGFGGSLATTIAVNRTITGEAEKIPKPCQMDAVIDGSDIDLDWVRRSRIGSYWSDDGDYTTPLGESLEQYVIRIKDGPGGSVLRTVTVDDVTAYTYASANITADFGSMPSELTWDIRQVSGTGVVCPARETTISL